MEVGAWDDPIVCVCMEVSEDQIVNAIETGNHSIEAIRRACGANTNCGGCREDIEELLEEVLSEHQLSP